MLSLRSAGAADVRLDFDWDKRAVRETGDLPSKSFADSTAIRAYRIRGPWGTPMDIAERFYIAAAALGFFAHRRNGLARMS